MPPDIEVIFSDGARDRSLVATVHRWVARFEAMSFDVHGAAVAIEPSGRKHTAVCLTITLAGGVFATAATTHSDPYVAVSDAFRAVRRELLERAPLDQRSRGVARVAPRDREQDRAVRR